VNILIAEDEAITRLGLRSLLADLGHTVVASVADGASALRLACELRPDLALLDIRMPGLDGLEVARGIAERCPLPVVMLTAYSERDLVARAAATPSVQAYLVKPVRAGELGSVLELAAARFQEWQALRQEVANLEDALAARDAVAKAKIVLMQRQGMAERDAFLDIQARARRERRTMREVAGDILSETP